MLSQATLDHKGLERSTDQETITCHLREQLDSAEKELSRLRIEFHRREGEMDTKRIQY